jgi:methylmalonyl-CoA mutase C-terminal domain/subunit
MVSKGKNYKIKILMAKTSLDGHDRGVKVVSKMLRDAGLEVIYLGKMLKPEQVIDVVIQEDVDVIGLSFLSGEHLTHTKKVAKIIKEKKLNVLFIVGGVIPIQDIKKLKKIGVDEVFPAGTLIDDIEKYIKQNVKK